MCKGERNNNIFMENTVWTSENKPGWNNECISDSPRCCEASRWKPPGWPRRASRAYSMVGILKERFLLKNKQNKTKTAVPEDEKSSACKPVEIHRYKCDPPKITRSSISKVAVKRNKWIGNVPEGHLNLVARYYYMLRTAFFFSFAVIQKETKGIFQLFQAKG